MVTLSATARAAGAQAQGDVAFWMRPTDTTLSTLSSVDRTAGKLFVYDGAGASIQTITGPTKPGNVDVRHRLPLGGGSADVVAINDRGNRRVVIHAVDPATRRLHRVDDGAIATSSGSYGLCLYRSQAGKRYAFVSYAVIGTGRFAS